MHDLSLMSIHGSAMTYVKRALLYRGEQASHELLGPLEQRRFRNRPIEPGGVCAPQPGGVLVVRETEERHIGEVLGDVVGVDPRDVGDHEVGRFDSIGGHEPMLAQDPLELASNEEVDPTQQDRRHV